MGLRFDSRAWLRLNHPTRRSFSRFGATGVTLLSIVLLAIGALALGVLCSARLVGAVCPAPVRRLAFWG